MSSRLEKLQHSLNSNPNDPFTRYLVALEHAKLDQAENAIEYFKTLVEKHPAYVPTYYQYAQLLEKLGRVPEAAGLYRAGIKAARAEGNTHAASELQLALDMIE